jgi:hypothetical protein
MHDQTPKMLDFVDRIDPPANQAQFSGFGSFGSPKARGEFPKQGLESFRMSLERANLSAIAAEVK